MYVFEIRSLIETPRLQRQWTFVYLSTHSSTTTSGSVILVDNCLVVPAALCESYKLLLVLFGRLKDDVDQWNKFWRGYVVKETEATETTAQRQAVGAAVVLLRPAFLSFVVVVIGGQTGKP